MTFVSKVYLVSFGHRENIYSTLKEKIQEKNWANGYFLWSEDFISS